jgi:hypothetical protein
MAKKNILRIILSLIGLSIGIFLVIAALRMESPNYVAMGVTIYLSLMSIGWLFNARWGKLMTGILVIPVGLAGSLWTLWDFIQDIFFDKGVIGNFPLLGYNMTIFLVPYIIVFAFFCWILVMGIKLVKDE